MPVDAGLGTDYLLYYTSEMPKVNKCLSVKSHYRETEKMPLLGNKGLCALYEE